MRSDLTSYIAYMAYIGSPVNPPQLTFAQTDLAVHQEWGRFTLKNAKASALMHFLVANMGREGALVASQPTLESMRKALFSLPSMAAGLEGAAA